MKYLFLPVLLFFLILSDGFCEDNKILLEGQKFNVSMDFQHLAISILVKEEELQVSGPRERTKGLIEKQTATEAVINYPELKKRFTVSIAEESLKIKIESEENDSFQWPWITNFKALTVPFHQGKYIPANDSIWVNYLDKRSYTGLESLSMQFFATSSGNHALVYLIDNKFNNEIHFSKAKGRLTLSFEHSYPSTVSKKEYGFTIRITDNSPTSIAKEYQKHILETTGIQTLEDKAKTNPAISKIYGAAHFYVWSQEFLALQNVKWDELIKYWHVQLSKKDNNPTKHIFILFANDMTGVGKEFINQWDGIRNSKYVNDYQKNLILRSLNEALAQSNFFEQKAWKNTKFKAEDFSFPEGILPKSETGLYQLNKQAFYLAYQSYLQPIIHWGNGVSLDILNDLQQSGIQNAWLGLNEWKPAFIHPDFVKTANQLGYLIAPYDDYHGIHPPGNESWNTSVFDDVNLYETATVSKKDGSKYAAFLGIGRKLNPTLAFPSVKKRVENILGQGIQFNSWFVDCDGTGEFLDDYTPGRNTSQEDDLNARLHRLRWLNDDKKMVVGTEVGNDFCANAIVYAHGMTTPVIEWGDPDMRTNKNSAYYLGDYYSLDGGVPSKFSKEVPIKPIYQYIYLDHRFNLPLFQLVYNNAVITSHHWEWGTLKIPSLIQDRQLQEMLYNVPPLYHIDRKEWARNKETIIKHVSEFRNLHMKAVLMEMLSFEYLSENKDIQRVRYGKESEVKLEVIANCSNLPFAWREKNIPPKSLVIYNNETGSSHIYTP